MKPFNLAETRITERAYCRRHINARLRNMALLVCLTVAVGAGSWACKLAVSGKATRTISELANVTGRTAKVKEEISTLKAQLSQNQWRRQLARASDRWLSVLDGVVECLPGDVWLIRVEASQKDSGVAIDGNAASFESLSRFVNALRCSPAFSEVQLRSTKASGAGGAFVDFSLFAKTAGGETPQPERSGTVPNVSQSP